MVKVKQDLTGMVFGRLTVLRQDEDMVNSRGEHVAKWLCQCSCSENKIVSIRGQDLKKKNGTRSCGCLHKENTSKAKKKYNKYDLSGDYGIGWASNTNKEFYFNLEDYDIIKDLCWLESEDKGVNRLIAYNPQTQKPIRMHILLGYKNHDHIDKNELNNIRSNLRECTHQQNDFNRGLYSNNTSGVTGVGWHKKCKKWKAAIMIDGKTIHLGVFVDKNDAIKARLNAEAKYYGEFAPQQNLFEGYDIEVEI
jgi:hypothetical protein